MESLDTWMDADGLNDDVFDQISRSMVMDLMCRNARIERFEIPPEGVDAVAAMAQAVDLTVEFEEADGRVWLTTYPDQFSGMSVACDPEFFSLN